MKKFIALLLCLVLLVPMFTLGISAEETVSCEQVRISLLELLKNKNDFLKNLLQRLQLPEQNHENDEGADSEKVPAPEIVPEEDNKVETEVAVSDYEKRVAELVNIEREKYGLKPLTLSKELSDGARLKSKDMHDNQYFSHTSPTYGSPFDMMKSLGISYRSAGENIAMGYSTPEAVVNAWMNSEGHRANILNASYTEIGVGYIADGGYYTQWFRG